MKATYEEYLKCIYIYGIVRIFNDLYCNIQAVLEFYYIYGDTQTSLTDFNRNLY